MTPAEELRAAAKLIRERAEAATGGEWGTRPWDVTECSDKERGECPCIVYQGEYKPFDEPQVPHIQYICDAEETEFAAHIAGMHPGVALAVAGWLDDEAERATGMVGYEDSDAYPMMLDGFRHPLAIARAYLGEAAAP